MGNTPSVVRDCLLAAVGNNPALVNFQNDTFFDLNTPLYNLNYPVVPTAITYPENSYQVAEIVKCAARNGLKVQAYSGGHSYANYGLGGEDGAIVVHMKNMHHFSMDKETHVASVGAGTHLGDLHIHLYHAGKRAVAHGACPQVGVGGHFTIGGLGAMSREWGTALDHIEAAEVVLANGSIVIASHEQNQDVLFAIKGAAASFGIVTEFKLRTHPAPREAIQYSYAFNLGKTSQRAQLFKDWKKLVSIENIPRQFATELVLFESGALLSGTFFGTKEEWEAFGLENHFPIHNSGNVLYLTNWLGMLTSQAENLIMRAAGGIPCNFYAKSMSFTAETMISDDGVDKMLEYIDSTSKGTLEWFIIFDLEGGAVNDHAVNATAYAHRDAIIWMQSYSVNPVGRITQKIKDFQHGLYDTIASTRPDARFGAYPGYVDPEMENAQSAYWGPNLPRLQNIKAAIDPTDLFHNPQSVRLNAHR
ncbi:hypothetical protein N7495_006871 [Penicillium taxi]|uniref:uncharacterized protein n=1 Tax=Penicillium taxi TaxID=168475 RepID=UPI00254528BD|nr:uncharacterized protein N7495_006871 [Penicillium taxi]KAJ5895180.1 hypothetical protein N7495_006871 [Penicillium taxi]